MQTKGDMTPLTLPHLCGEAANARYHLPADRDVLRQRCVVIDGSAGDAKTTMEAIRQYVHNTFELYEKVFDCLACTSAFYVPPVHRLRHPMIFYYGHTATFYINKLCVAGLTTRIDPHLEEMCAIGVDEMSWDDLDALHYDWPSVHDVCAYRQRVRDRLDAMMCSGKYALELPLTFANSTRNDASAFWWVMLMGAEHERIHVETASVHVRELPVHLVRADMAAFWQPCRLASATAPVNELVSIAGGRVAVGRPPQSPMYGWDCDYSDGALVADVAPFRASKYVVSNAEFMAFIKADGYHTSRYWDEEGWAWVQWRKPQHPWFWVRDEASPDGYKLRLQTTLIDLPWDWPCELNHLEARAFCNYKSEKLGTHVRMPTEEEWLLLYDRYVVHDQPHWPPAVTATQTATATTAATATAACASEHGGAPGNVNLEHYCSSCPVNRFAHGPLYDVVGNVWQHCETAVYPYTGFRVHPFYDDFSVPTFDRRHACMKGGAWISTGNEATRDARFAFRRHFFQFIGLRYVEADDGGVAGAVRDGASSAQPQRRCAAQLYTTVASKSAEAAAALPATADSLDPETDTITDASYRDSFAGIANGCVAIAQYAQRTFAAHARVPALRALDIACGAGRVSFELTPHFATVVGVEYTARRLVTAFAMRERGSCQYTLAPRGGGGAAREVRVVHASDYAATWAATRERATFFQADPTNLHAHLDGFALIVCWNCLERSYRPSAIPGHLLSRLLPGGILVVGGDYNYDNIKTTAHDTQQSESSYVSDALYVAPERDVQDRIYELLGGDAAVERVGERASIPVVFADNGTRAVVRVVQLAAYRKK